MHKEEIQTEFNETFTELLKILSSFNQENFNTKPAEDKWSAGQVARHLIKANSGFPQVINGPTEKTEREPDEMVEKIKADFLNFEKEMKSPDFIVPEDEDYEKKDLINSLEKIKSEIDETAQNADLTKTCLGFEFPVLGHLTGLETLSFVVYHTQRHIHQLKKIYEKV
jgi:hypothetical protein